MTSGREKRVGRRRFGEVTLQHVSGITERLEEAYPGEADGVQILDTASGNQTVCNIDNSDPGASTAEVATSELARLIEARRLGA